MTSTRPNIFDFNHIDTTLSKGPFEISLYLLPQEALRLPKTVPQPSKKKPALRYCGRQSYDNFSGCWVHHFEPRRVRFFDWFWSHCKSGGKLHKIRQKSWKANFARVEYKKSLMRFGFISEVTIVDDFISDRCMETPAKVEKKHDKHFTAVWILPTAGFLPTTHHHDSSFAHFYHRSSNLSSSFHH